MSKSEELFLRAKECIPGGVNSPVRAFGSVGGIPPFMERGKGCYLWDVDGKCYVDFVASWGPLILGHGREEVVEAVQKAAVEGLSFGAATEKEVVMAELLCELVPGLEMVRMVNSGTEAVMSALRLARGYTGRDKIIKFSGCYHGHTDAMLVKAGSGLLTGGLPNSRGVTEGSTEDILLANYNDLSSVEALFSCHQGAIAAIIVEPVAANMGVVLPEDGFLQGLKDLCVRNGALLLFDEVITGFRLGLSGASGYYGVIPDLFTYGKIIGGGLPVGAYGGRKEIMECVAPVGSVYQAGTLSGNPIAMAAGMAQLQVLKKEPAIYEALQERGDFFFHGLKCLLEKYEIKGKVNHIGSLGCLFFTNEDVRDYESAQLANTEAYRDYFNHLLRKSIYLAPSQFEAMFLGIAHEKNILDEVLKKVEEYFSLLK